MDTSIGFASNLIPIIIKGSKQLTYRLGNKYKNLKIDDEIDFRDSSSNEVIGKLKITERSNIKFKDLPINRNGHEVYNSKENQKETFKKYYKKEIDDKEDVIVIGFKVIKLY